ncbi:MAG: recombinase family protein [Acidimicrobiia bacterium]|nr:recombinase family protein [Acidimicrobiia bacterium]MBT8250143.1 recombinase family protein [Acidimicrobiia bacterium]NNL28306.1 recombinase family protein [Acidimicrobiia bacterium]NNL48932.1 recombinase family protein [Acidimicrobiia bacterium]
MRVVGYVRESSHPDDGIPAFVQGEKIRAWSRQSGHQLLAWFQDVRQEGHQLSRDGFKALLQQIERSDIEAVVVADLAVLASDVTIQEIMLWDLRLRGVSVISADPSEMRQFEDPSTTRVVIRDLLTRVEEYRTFLESTNGPTRALPAPYSNAEEVIVELLPAVERQSQDRPTN